ncbi:SH3 domain-containing protein [Psychromarinibacter sp. C21-152]|uniref:SH3 domain-containing protein n=1 Tax=Psychromarinibacter sediminicola TaxID=3033385 RepID=A0AAE3T983_9RHOB|nr:SH3 domain-containing protein [Psychromarinibacter sediminicola]MDF0600744.1 SH3 domain-containing protein [Psychromarinibacter sediminicola]
MLARLTTAVAVVFFALAAQAETMMVNSPNDGFLNLRTGPGNGYQIIMQMPHSSLLETLERSGNWLRVRHESGYEGWAYRKYMVRYDPTPNLYRVYSPNDGFLNLRTGPGTRFAIITPMYNGTEVRILEWSGKWVRVQTEYGQQGWAYSSYLVK